MFTEFESTLVSYERCLKIFEIPQEAPQHIEQTYNANWPKTGQIKFDNLSLKYRPDTEIVLNSLSFTIKNGEKIGVIGRTGAGKSTLWLALCRIVEAHGGRILIDGTDISSLGLEDLRQKITIIPQDATLFNGSLRFNLDPQGMYSDQDLIELANQASLEKLINRDDKGLDQQIEESGQNLSSGEKQLLWICRAVLKKNKVVLMDEATANIDIKTEQTIQQLINEKFTDATVITIAHRLNTIMESDRILVLSQGEVAEFDSPSNLLNNPNSMFSSYVNSFQKE
jgi:ATP-binding cassette subfamily C (CFTR/MRP) protein 1